MRHLLLTITLILSMSYSLIGQNEISILFAYTRKAAQEVGGPSVIKQNVDNGMRLLNEALVNSNIGYNAVVSDFVYITLPVNLRDEASGIESIEDYFYSQSNLNVSQENFDDQYTTLLFSELSDPSCSFNELYKIRNERRADIICLIYSYEKIKTAKAALNGEVMIVTAKGAWGSTYVFPHEFGHVLGAEHDPLGEANPVLAPANNRYLYDLGERNYRYQPPRAIFRRTVSNNGGVAIPYFSEDRTITYSVDITDRDGNTSNRNREIRIGDENYNNAATMRANVPKKATLGENLSGTPSIRRGCEAFTAQIVDPETTCTPPGTKTEFALREFVFLRDGTVRYEWDATVGHAQKHLDFDIVFRESDDPNANEVPNFTPKNGFIYSGEPYTQEYNVIHPNPQYRVDPVDGHRAELWYQKEEGGPMELRAISVIGQEPVILDTPDEETEICDETTSPDPPNTENDVAPPIKIVDGGRAPSERFGTSVAIDGDYAIVGAEYDNNNNGDGIGSVSFFQKDANGNWNEVQSVSNPTDVRALKDRSFFGAKVDISGNYAVVVARTMNGANAPTYPNGQTLLFNLGQSAVVLFELKNGQWQRMPNTLFRAGENDSGHYMSFGADVAISNNYLIVGEPFYPLENQIPVGAARPGRARIYSRNNNWSELTTPLTPINDTQNGFFGGSVDISDNHAIVGAQADNDGAGTVHIFNNENGQWNNEPIIDAPSGDIQAFGRSVAVSGDYVVIGAEGTAYIYNYEDDRWNLQSTLTPQFNTPEERQYLTSSFGRSVAISDEYVIVGASGSAFKYNIQGELQEILVAYDRNMTDNFGQAVDISNSNIIVSAMDEDEDVEGENTLDGAGAAYIFSTSELSSPTSDIQPTTTDEVSAQIKEFTPNSLISAINDNTAWGLDTDDRIYCIEDTGWKQPSTEARLRVVSAVDDDIAWGVNKNDIIYRTNDGGKKWNVGGRTARLSMVSAVDYNTAWGVNKEGKIYRTNNGGKNWNSGGGVAARLAVVSAIDYNTAWGVNKEGKIYRTNNGGTTWQLLTPNSRLVNISAVDYRTAWGVNKDGLIYRTNNGGGKWQGVSGKLKTISAVDYNTAWGVNETGKKYRTTDGGNTWQEVQ